MNAKAILGHKPYPYYKSSASLLIADIPNHWHTPMLKVHLSLNESGVWSEEPDDRGTIILRSTEQALDGRWQIENPARLRISETQRESARLYEGDLVVTKSSGSRAHIGKTAIVDSAIAELECCFSNFMQRLRTDNELSPSFLWYFLNNWVGREALLTDSTTTTGLANLNATLFGHLRVPIPPLDEQAAIVRYLDDADQRIRAFVSAKERLIALLEEERRAVIHQAVTRGLEPNVKLKPSGVEWLGDVPEHWVGRRLKQVARIQTGITLGKEYRSQELIERPYLRVANVQSGHLDLSEITTVRVPLAEVKKTTLEIGDVLMTEGGDIDKLGRGCLWHGEVDDCLHQNHVFAVRPNRQTLIPAFLVALMGTPHGRNYFHSTAKQTTNLAATNGTTLGEFPMHLPKAREQQTIVDYISEQDAERKDAIDRAHRQIELMEEYRTKLIADVVTGKLDVR